jgi:hypothetical protein
MPECKLYSAMTLQHFVFIWRLLFAFRLWSFSCVCLWLSWHWASQQQKTRILPPARDPERSDVLFPPTSSGVRVLTFLTALVRPTCDYIKHEKFRIEYCTCVKLKHIRVFNKDYFQNIGWQHSGLVGCSKWYGSKILTKIIKRYYHTWCSWIRAS